MKFPNWFKITLWILLLLLTGIILITRLEAITIGQSVAADVYILIIFVVLMLVPIFSEIEFYGLKLKREIEGLKADLKIRLGDLKNEIRTTQSQTLYQTIQHGQFGPPPPDNKLPELEEEIDRLLKSKLEQHGITTERTITGRIDVPEDNLTMFKVRYNIEMQLRRIWYQRFDERAFDYRSRNQSLSRIIQDLTKFEIINGNLNGILREIIAICNYAIHGEKLTDKQIDFVTKNAKYVLDYLGDVK